MNSNNRSHPKLVHCQHSKYPVQKLNRSQCSIRFQSQMAFLPYSRIQEKKCFFSQSMVHFNAWKQNLKKKKILNGFRYTLTSKVKKEKKKKTFELHL